jgi:effector-binding domain-containing protein
MTSPPERPATPPQPPRQPSGFEAEIKQVPALTVAYLAMRGPYGQMKEGFPKLYHWLAAFGLAPDGMPAAIYLTDPSEVAEEDATWELWAPFAGDADPCGPNEKGLGIKRIDPMTVASTLYKGPYDGMEPTYQALARWVSENRYTQSGPPIEIYMSDPADTKPEDYLTEIQIPVSK